MTKIETDGSRSWVFDDDTLDFSMEDPQMTSDLYFPLANESGMMCCITPTLAGDSKTCQSEFLLEPVSVSDLKEKKSSRNFWVRIDENITWSATGMSAMQECKKFDKENGEKTELNAGFLWHTIYRKNEESGISSEITNFVPVNEDHVELMKVTLKNISKIKHTIEPIAAVPIYARSADNIRDHRHVTSLLNRICVNEYGIIVCPSMSFDERGHRRNSTCYSVQGIAGDGLGKPTGFFPICDEFEGESGSLEWPYAVVKGYQTKYHCGEEIDGYEAMGGLVFEKEMLSPGESKSYVIVMSITGNRKEADCLIGKYGSNVLFEKYLEENKRWWNRKLSVLDFDTADKKFGKWMRWVELQPCLRRVFGCSFLPYHDYGKGGRGWRDLWQDCLALMLSDPVKVGGLLFDNYAGVRFDGSNATIIGEKQGEFIADRNNIARVWMDHGAWPYQTTKMYLDLTGDVNFLFREQTYFKDGQWSRTHERDTSWTEDYGNKQKDCDGRIYKGSILEHIIIENLTMFYNIGRHGNIRLEGADWNDAFDLAKENGESVAFTSFYAGNLKDIGILLEQLNEHGVEKVSLAKEIIILIDKTLPVENGKRYAAAHTILDMFFNETIHGISGDKYEIDTAWLSKKIWGMGEQLEKNISENEWIINSEGYGWLNGYYDDKSQKLEGDNEHGVRMTLTGQVFGIMYGTVPDEKVKEIIRSVNRYLWDEKSGGVRLNTDFHEIKMDMGRCFGFAFGSKENGAVFCHMAVMYANALYKRGFVHEGYRVLDTLYRHSCDFGISRVYPGIPEYFDLYGRGRYSYLTGAASWLLITVLNEVFGIRGDMGNLCISPALVSEQFSKDGRAFVTTVFRNRKIKITYINEGSFDYGDYSVNKIELDGKDIFFARKENAVEIDGNLIENLTSDEEHVMVIKLSERKND